MSCGAAAPPLVRLEGLSLSVRQRPLLKDVHMEIHRGEIHAIVGPNGAGKSTLLRELARHRRQQIWWSDHRLRVGYVPQALDIDESLPLTAKGFIDLCLRPIIPWPRRLTGRPPTDEILEGVGLGAQAHTPLARLSGGEKRRLLVALALEPPPDLLLLDEPGEGVDREGLELIEEQVRRRAAEGAAVLLVSHDQSQIARLATRTTRLEAGVITGRTSRVTAEP